MPQLVIGPRTADAWDVRTEQVGALALRAWTPRADPDRQAGGTTPDVVLVHGLGASAASYERLAPRLAGSAVHLLDLPGFAGVPRPRRALTIEDLATLLTRWIERRGLARPVLVGHSMGAQVVVEAAAAAPGLASHLVLAGPTVDAAARSAARQTARLARSAVHESPQARAVVLRAYAACGPRWFSAMLAATVAHRVEERLPHVDVPVLVVRGEHDRVAPAGWTRRLAQAAAHGRAVTVAGAGHAVVYDRAAEVAALVREHVGA